MTEQPPKYQPGDTLRLVYGDVRVRKTWFEDGVRRYLIEWTTHRWSQPVSLTEERLTAALESP